MPWINFGYADRARGGMIRHDCSRTLAIWCIVRFDSHTSIQISYIWFSISPSDTLSSLVLRRMWAQLCSLEWRLGVAGLPHQGEEMTQNDAWWLMGIGIDRHRQTLRNLEDHGWFSTLEWLWGYGYDMLWLWHIFMWSWMVMGFTSVPCLRQGRCATLSRRWTRV